MRDPRRQHAEARDHAFANDIYSNSGLPNLIKQKVLFAKGAACVKA